MKDDWYWACPQDGAAGNRFIIENGREAFWARVQSEFHTDRCMWMPIHPKKKKPDIADILEMLLTVVPMLHVSKNAFVFEAAKIPAFARFIRNARCNLCDYVSNTAYLDHASKPEAYSDEARLKLGRIVSRTLNIDEDWWD